MAPSELLESVLGVGYVLCHVLHAGVLPNMATRSLIVCMMALAVLHVYCTFTFSEQAHRLPSCLRLHREPEQPGPCTVLEQT